MAGLIKADDVQLVKERASIEDVVREHVTLRAAGVGSLKGLCPFHDEKSPSFHVRPQVGAWHCFGCGEGGDVISFVQKVDHLTFAEAVERLAVKAGVQLRYEEGAGPRREDVGKRARLLEAHRAAAQFYAEQLGAPEALPGRRFLDERGFDRAAAELFGVGYAPKSGEALTRHLRGKGFTDDELVTGGISGRGNRGLYDRFRGRLVWPIRDITGDVVGFGARRLLDDDRIEAKYLNTPESPLYKKSQVLYGIDLAKKAMARDRRAVVVEGYTDVMACHLAGVETAVATCGTAFGSDHATVLRRIVRDDDEAQAEVVFTFDGDAAGQKAAMRAFADDQRFVSQTYVAVESSGMDPCELRQARGDDAVRDLVAARVPLFEFAIRTTIGRFDLERAEGRVQALRAGAPVVAGIRDRSLRPEYARRLAGWLGMDVDEVRRAVASAGRAPSGGRGPGGAPPAETPASRAPEASDAVPAGLPRPDPRDPVVAAERQLLQCVLQVPHVVEAVEFDSLGADAFAAPAHRAVHDAVRAAGGVAVAQHDGSTAWVERVSSAAASVALPVVSELAVAPLPVAPGRDGIEPAARRLAESLVHGLVERDLVRQKADLFSALQRANESGDTEQAQRLNRDLMVLQERQAALRRSP